MKSSESIYKKNKNNYKREQEVTVNCAEAGISEVLRTICAKWKNVICHTVGKSYTIWHIIVIIYDGLYCAENLKSPSVSCVYLQFILVQSPTFTHTLRVHCAVQCRTGCFSRMTTNHHPKKKHPEYKKYKYSIFLFCQSFWKSNQKYFMQIIEI